jgi:hypothetical protein
MPHKSNLVETGTMLGYPTSSVLHLPSLRHQGRGCPAEQKAALYDLAIGGSPVACDAFMRTFERAKVKDAQDGGLTDRSYEADVGRWLQGCANRVWPRLPLRDTQRPGAAVSCSVGGLYFGG